MCLFFPQFSQFSRGDPHSGQLQVARPTLIPCGKAKFEGSLYVTVSVLNRTSDNTMDCSTARTGSPPAGDGRLSKRSKSTCSLHHQLHSHHHIHKNGRFPPPHARDPLLYRRQDSRRLHVVLGHVQGQGGGPCRPRTLFIPPIPQLQDPK